MVFPETVYCVCLLIKGYELSQNPTVPQNAVFAFINYVLPQLRQREKKTCPESNFRSHSTLLNWIPLGSRFEGTEVNYLEYRTTITFIFLWQALVLTFLSTSEPYKKCIGTVLLYGQTKAWSERRTKLNGKPSSSQNSIKLLHIILHIPTYYRTL